MPMIKRLIEKIKDKTAFQIIEELRWIGAYSRRYIWAICWYIFLGIVSTLIGLAAGIVSKDIIDIVTGQRTGHVVQAAIIYVVMNITTIVLGGLSSRISAKVQLRVSQDLRADIFKRIMQAEWEPLSEYHSGDLLTRSARDTDTIAGNVIGWIPSLVVNFLKFTGTFLVLFWFDSTLALLALASAPITLFLSSFLIRRIRKHSKEMRNIASETSVFHTEAFRNIRFIKAYHAIDTYSDKLKDLQEKQKEATLEYNKFSIFTSTFLSFVGMVVGGVCFLWSAYRLWGNHITFGEMMLFLQLSGSLAGAFGALVSLIPNAVTAATAAGRIMEITQLPTEKQINQTEVQSILQSGCGVRVQAENMSFSYKDGKEVFKNCAFRADAGECVAFIGPSGGGKTTLLRLMLGLLSSDKENITLCCDDLNIELDVSPSTRSLFAYVPQDNTLFSGTVAENLRLTNPNATEEMMEEALKNACAYEFVSALPNGVHTRVGENGSRLSKGQIQRLALARAILSDAPILLLDEATSALDVRTERKLLENIMECRKGRTCIITTHKSSVLAICQKAYLIKDRNITFIEKEQAEQIMKNM